MKRLNTATLTFHASHNYGSMLQAYALQHFLIKEIGVDNEIINFRSIAQKKMYSFPKEEKHSWKYNLIKYLLPNTKEDRIKKYNLFESFLSDYLTLSPEYNEEKDVIKYADKFDFLITGSDQIWNTKCIDFNWLYYLPFAKSNAIAYAPSMGPRGINAIADEHYDTIKDCLHKFKAISVREEGTAKAIYSISRNNAETLIDPTLLISKKEWDELSGNEPIIKGEYIFIYHPIVNKEFVEIAKNVSSKMGLPLYVSNRLPLLDELKNKFSLTNKMHYKLDVGPIEFLNLLKNAKYVISGSFHAVVFSIIFQKPFLAVNGKTDNRMSQLLKATHLLDYGVDKNNYLAHLKCLENIDFTHSIEYLEEEKHKSISFLKQAFDL